MSVRHIHTQAQAQAELERERAVWRASYARRKERKLNGPPAEAQAERERQRAAQRASYIRRKENMLNDPEYREQLLQSRKIGRDKKRQAIEDDPLHVDARKDADRKAKVRRMAREVQETNNALERQEMIEAVLQRYFSYNSSGLMSFRIAELDAQFADLQVKEQQWPLPGPDVRPMYKKYLTHTYKLGQNIVCACCGCISHDITEFEIVLDSYGPLRRHLRIPEHVDIPFDFSCGIDLLDQNRVLIDKLGITQDKRIYLCRGCHNQFSKDCQPSEALANFRWVGPVPEELRDLTWIEELLVARVHVCGSIVRLGQRNNPSSFFGIKGHVVFLPQDTTRLIDLLPMSPASLSDMVKVVWTGKSKPDRSRLRSRFMVRKHKVYNALKWLVENHDDYRNNVTIDEERINGWESTFVAVELLDSIGHVSDSSVEDTARDGFAMDNPDDNDIADDNDNADAVDDTAYDLPFTSSGIVDVNNIAEVPDATTLNRLAQLKADITANVVTGSKVLNQYDCDTYFTSAFPTLFPYGTGKHRDSRREGKGQLSLLKWVSLMLRHSSRFLSHAFPH